jgi:hypothetical protein
VQVLVGEKRTPFSIYKDLLVQNSDYLARACEPNAHGETGPIHLPDVSEEIFLMFQKWLFMRVTQSYAAQGAALDDHSLVQEPIDNPDTTIGSLTFADSDSSEDENYNSDATSPSESGLSYSMQTYSM